MATIEVAGKKIELDEDGYLVNFDDWNEEVACAMADKEGISRTCPLTAARMDILKFMRNYYKQFQAFPIVAAVCKNIHQPRDCEYEKFVDPIQAWKIAGLPKPTTEVFQYVQHQTT